MFLLQSNTNTKKRNKKKKRKHVSFSDDLPTNTVVVDCHHKSAYQLTHHLKNKNQKNNINHNLRGDSSTDAVINAIKQNDEKFANCDQVASNHFDVDSFLSVWSAINEELALKYENVLRWCAKIGDFRELRLENSDQDHALRLSCWLNSVEKRMFYKPFESTISSMNGEEKGDAKFDYFLVHFEDVLVDPIKYYDEYQEEYDLVVGGYETLNGPIEYDSRNGSIIKDKNHIITHSSLVSRHDDLGLVVVITPEPLHYYSLFSVSLGCDIVLSCYSKNRYELEVKYTTYVDINSRPTLPRVELKPLADRLNEIDAACNGGKLRWVCSRITDSGPILRIEDEEFRLSKAQRYDHPYERTVLTSDIEQTTFITTVLSFFSFAYENVKSRKDWEWKDLHDYNRNLQWPKWNGLAAQ